MPPRRAPTAGRTRPEPALGPVLEFLRLLWALEQGLNQRSKAMLRRFGVTGEQRLLVRMLGKLGPSTPGALARVLHVHPATVIRLARPLERRRVLVRRDHPADGRQVLLALGPGATAIEALDAGTVEAAVRAALASARPVDVERTRRVLAEIARRLLPGGAQPRGPTNRGRGAKPPRTKRAEAPQDKEA